MFDKEDVVYVMVLYSAISCFILSIISMMEGIFVGDVTYNELHLQSYLLGGLSLCTINITLGTIIILINFILEYCNLKLK